jgi:hypothetical protein
MAKKTTAKASQTQVLSNKLAGAGNEAQNIATEFVKKLCAPKKNRSQDAVLHRESLRDSQERGRGPQHSAKPATLTSMGGPRGNGPKSRKKGR